MVWIVEWRYDPDYEVNTTCWESEKDAYTQACNEMLEHIQNNWNLSNLDIKNCAIEINDLIKLENYSEALDKYSDFIAEWFKEPYWLVYALPVLNHGFWVKPNPINFD